MKRKHLENILKELKFIGYKKIRSFKKKLQQKNRIENKK